MVLEPNPFEFGYVVGFLGLLGLYPPLADRVPRLALATAAIAAVAGAGLVLASNWLLGPNVLASVAAPPAAFRLGIYALPFLGIGLFGVLSSWIDVPSRTIGLLLLTYLVVIVGAVIASSEHQFGLAGLVSPIALTVGYVHESDAAGPTEQNRRRIQPRDGSQTK